MNAPAFRIAFLLAILPGTTIPAAEIDFNRDIRPILSNNCFKCHGPDENNREAGLRLDIREAAISPLESGSTAITPAKPGESELVARIESNDPDVMMPPPSSNKHLTDTQKQLLKNWVAAGAEYKQHWSFIKPSRPAVPDVAEAHASVQNPIDNFILEGLGREHLSMSAEADPYVLVRRVYLDLIGIPPTPEEADAYVKDTAADKYERLVDRLLASPHYGERWARRWLDLARYADSNGYEKDRPRSIWPYRDWVIKALNDDMPFDQFTIRQVAGDMLPNATLDDIVATGFHRNTMINEEGGIDPQEFRFYANVDRVGTTGAVWLGLTLACAQCHTHKYDPIVHKEFYQLLAFFDEADEPLIDVPKPDLEARRKEIEQEIAAAEIDLPNRFPLGGDYKFTPIRPASVVSSENATMSILEDGAVLASGAKPPSDTYTVTLDVPAELLAGSTMAAIRLEALTDPSLSKNGPGRTPHGNFVLTKIAVSAAPSGATEPSQNLAITHGEAEVEQDGFGTAGALDDDPHTGWAIHQPGVSNWNSNRTATFFFEKSELQSTGVRLVVTLNQQYGDYHTLGKFKLSIGTQPWSSQPTSEQRQALVEKKFQDWAQQESQRAVRWTILKPAKLASNLPYLDVLDDNSVLASGDQTKLDVYDLTYENLPKKITAIRLETLTHPSLSGGGPGRIYYEGTLGDFFLSELNISADSKPLKFSGAAQTFAAGRNVAANAVDGNTDTAWTINGGQGKPQTAVFNLTEPLEVAKSLDFKFSFETYYASALGRFRISVTDETVSTESTVLPTEVELLLTKYSTGLDQSEQKKLQTYWLSITPELAGERAKIETLRNSMPDFPTTLAIKQRSADRYRQTHRYHRGEFLQPKEPVETGGLEILHAFPKDKPKDRLAMARWLVDRDNPLVARVTVNRDWSTFFGHGLVRTLQDFGTQGDLPTHPELLDWLAVEFMDRGWSQKAIHRLMVTSATYRQSSNVTKVLSERDPQNMLYARGPRVRLEAELIRDCVLSAAGLLSNKLGGPSVFPPQLPSITTEGAYGSLPWKVSKGADRHRRSLYTFSKRTAPFAMFATFDAPSGEACVPRRDVSNTPLQALTLLNDAMLFEAAESLGKSYASSKESSEQRIESLFRRCLTRPPKPAEQDTLLKFVEQQRDRFPDNEALVWTALARAVFNLDEMIVKQ